MELPALNEPPRLGFPPESRLLKPADFTAVFEQRRARRGKYFHLHYGHARLGEYKDSVAAGARLGIAVPKKLLKTAVHRNLVKRLARETFRQLQGFLDRRDFVLRLSSKLDAKTVRIDRDAIRGDIRKLFTERSPQTLSAPPVNGTS